MREDPLQEELGPALTVELRGPGRQRLTAHALEQAALGERAIREHGDAAVAGERQDPGLGLALAHRIVDLEEVERLAPEHAVELVVGVRRVVGRADVTSAGRGLTLATETEVRTTAGAYDG